MADPRNPDPYRPFPVDDDIRSPQRLDDALQAAPELAEGPASSGRIAVLALGIAVVLGAVFYGLNNTSMNSGTTTATTQTAPAPQSTAQTRPPAPTNNIADSGTSKPAVPPGVRDVTPYNNDNNQPAVTTGAAPSRPQPPTAVPSGTEVDRSKGAPANSAR